MTSKTVLLASNLYRPNIGGVENSLYHLGLAYSEMGYKVVIAASDINHENVSLPMEEIEQGMHIHRYPIHDVRGPFRYFRHWINAVKLFKQLKEEYQPDLMICRYHQTCLMMALAGLKDTIYLIPGVVHFQNAPDNLSHTKRPFLSRLKHSVDFSLNKVLQKVAFKQARKLAVFSQSMIEQVTSIVDIDKSNILIGKPGVSLKRFYLETAAEKQSAREAVGITGDCPVFFCIGRFVRAKGFDIVIHAMQKVKNAQLCILGAGEEKERYQELIEQYDLSDKVFLHESSDQPELYYRAADYFLMPSRYEPLGQTILEALASGLPVLAFPSSLVDTATFELLGDENAFYADKVSPDSMANTMNSVLQMTPEDYDKTRYNNHQFAAQHFTWAALANQLKKSVS